MDNQAKKTGHFIYRHRALLYAVVGSAVLALSSLLPAPTYAESSQSALIFWSQLAGSKKAAGDDLEAAFKQSHPDIALESNLFGDPVQLNQKILTSLNSNTAPDLFVQHWSYALAYAHGNKLLKLDNIFDKKQLTEVIDVNLLAFNEVHAAHYALPLYSSSRGLAFNRALVIDAGLDPNTPPRNWAELREWAVKLTQRDSQGNLQVSGFNLFNNDEAAAEIFTLLLQGAGGSLLTDDHHAPAFAGPEGIKALQFIYDLVYVDKVTDVGFGVGGTGSNHIFNQKRSAAYVAGNYSINHAKNAGIDLLVAAFPKEHGGYTSYVDPFTLGIPASASNPQAATAYIRFALSLDQQVAFALTSKNVPALKAAQQDPRFLADPILAQFAQFAAYAPTHPPVTGAISEINVILAQAVQSVVYQKATPKQALDAAAAKVQPLLAE